MKQNILVNNLEEIAVGKEINGEFIIGNDNAIVQTIEELRGHATKKTYLLNSYVLEKTTLQPLESKKIPEKYYNEYLNLIKQKTN